MSVCQCKHRGCICDGTEALNSALICGFCELDHHWTRKDELKHEKRLARHRQRVGESLGYLRLLK